MEDILYCKDFMSHFKFAEPKPKGKSDATWTMMNKKDVRTKLTID